jgi:hypothetical protein
MNKYLIIFLFVFLLLGLSKATVAKNEMVVSLNLKDCNNCVNALQTIRGVDTSNVKLTIVMEQKYRSDSAIIIRDNYLNEIPATLLWNDSLYQANIISSSISSVLYRGAQSSVKVPLKSIIGTNFVSVCNMMASQKFSLDVGHLNLGGGVSSFRFTGGKIYYLDEVRNEIGVHSLIDGTEHKMVISDSLWKHAFILRFGKDTQWRQSKEVIDALKIARYRDWLDFDITSDGSIFATAEFLFFKIRGVDTIGFKLYSLFEYAPSGLLKSIKTIEAIDPIDADNVTSAELRMYSSNQFYPRGFFVGDSVIAFSVMGKKPPRHGAVFYKPSEGESVIRFAGYTPFLLPEVYKDYGRRFSNAIFSQNGKYMTWGLSDIVYKTHSKDEKIETNFFKNVVQFSKEAPGYKRMTQELKVSDAFVYTLYWDTERDCEIYAAYNRATQKITEVELKMAKGFEVTLHIDDLDFNYIYYVNAESELVRLKIFNS